MKIGELVDGKFFMITNEQHAFFKQLQEQNLIRDQLSDREQRLAEEMTSLGIIDREYDDEAKQVIYKLQQK